LNVGYKAIMRGGREIGHRGGFFIERMGEKDGGSRGKKDGGSRGKRYEV
jgi:hypothetical protein